MKCAWLYAEQHGKAQFLLDGELVSLNANFMSFFKINLKTREDCLCIGIGTRRLFVLADDMYFYTIVMQIWLDEL